MGAANGGSTKPIYLIDGKPHKECDCDQFSQICQKGRERGMVTAGFDRCYLPIAGIVVDGVVLTFENDPK